MPDFDSGPFDEAAEKASKELEALLATSLREELAGIKKICEWWKDYYMTAGHKRLGRILVQKAKEL